MQGTSDLGVQNTVLVGPAAKSVTDVHSQSQQGLVVDMKLCEMSDKEVLGLDTEEAPFHEINNEHDLLQVESPDGNHVYTEVSDCIVQENAELLFQDEVRSDGGLAETVTHSQQAAEMPRGQVEPDYDIELCNLILESGQFNYCGNRIPVHSHWNTDLLSQLLTGYHDRAVTEFLKYGWPVDRDPAVPISHEVPKNHKGATLFPEAVCEFINTGLANNYIAGPYDFPAFGHLSVNSPINSRPKRSSTQRRILMDLSWPQDGTSVNAGLSKDFYLQQPMKLRYPTVQTFIQRIKKLGPGCLMYKRDLHKSFYQLPLCPSAYRLIGFSWEGRYYFKKVMPMGLTCACMAMQRTTLALQYIHNQMGYYLCPYVDDLGGCETPEVAWAAYEALGRTMRDVGAQESPEKAVPPTPVMEFLGNNLNTLELTISVTAQRVDELKVELEEWESRPTTTRKQLESIIGKLQFCCNCVRSGRVFLNRLLNFLRCMSRRTAYRIPAEARADLKWWKTYLPQFPAKSLMWLEQFQVDEILASDASLKGAGGTWNEGKQYYRCVFPEFILEDSSICHLELWALLIGLKIWHTELQGKAITLHCDNQAVAELINTGRARDEKLQKGLRELCYLAATGGFEVLGKFIPGCTNRLPDLLSRWHMGEDYRKEFRKLATGFSRRTVRRSMFYYTHDW